MVRYGEVSTDKGTRKNWLRVGQQVVVRADRYNGKVGTVTAVDKRFNRPYTVRVQVPGGSKNVNFAAHEIRITRF